MWIGSKRSERRGRGVRIAISIHELERASRVGGEDGIRAEVNRRLIIAGADPSIGKITWWDEPEDVRVFRWERDAGVWERVWWRLRR